MGKRGRARAKSSQKEKDRHADSLTEPKTEEKREVNFLYFSTKINNNKKKKRKLLFKIPPWVIFTAHRHEYFRK